MLRWGPRLGLFGILIACLGLIGFTGVAHAAGDPYPQPCTSFVVVDGFACVGTNSYYDFYTGQFVTITGAYVWSPALSTNGAWVSCVDDPNPTYTATVSVLGSSQDVPLGSPPVSNCSIPPG